MPAADFTHDELLDLPRNLRAHKLYGFSPVEQIALTINIALRRDAATLDYYRAGSVSDAFATLPKDWTVDQIRQFQDYFDALMSGNLARRRMVKFMPSEFRLIEARQPPLKDQYDEWPLSGAPWPPNSKPLFPIPTGDPPMFVFGSGVLIGTPQGGSPINFGLAQEISLNISTSTKSLFGQYNFPVAIGAGTRKMTGKAKLARISGQALGSLFFGVTPSAGSTQTQFGEATSVPASSPYTYTPSFHATFVADQGVVYAASALPFKQVASSPTAGQYSLSAGVYTFAAADAGAAVLISYTYTLASSGESIAVSSQLIGPSVDLLRQSVRHRPDDRQAVLDAALQLRRRQAGARHQARRLHDARARLRLLRQRRRPGLPAQLRRRRVSDETFVVALGGRRWALPHLPFRAIKAIQPALFQIYADAGGDAASSASVASLGEAQFDRLAEATWRAIAVVDPALAYEDFLDLPFSVGELIQALPALAKAAGLRAQAPRGDAGGVASAGKIDFDA